METSLEGWVKVVDYTSDPDGTDLWQRAASTVTSMSQEDVEQAAITWLVQEVRALRRGQTRQVEQASTPRQRRRLTAEERAEREEEREASWHRLMNAMGRAMNDYAAALKTEWTQELLESRFALPDGSTVEWGAATIEDHQQRVEMFAKSATASVENGARHQQAIDVLTESGAACLNDYIRKE